MRNEIKDSTLNLIKKFEGCKLEAYKDSVGIPTIGWGNTYYEDKTKVKMGDKITADRAESLLHLVVIPYGEAVNKSVKKELTQNQYDSLVSFTYNVGIANFNSSTLLKKINVNPNDPAITEEFKKWCKGGGVVIKGLLNRRISEATNYYS